MPLEFRGLPQRPHEGPVPVEAVLYAASFSPAALKRLLRGDQDFRYAETADTVIGNLLIRSLDDASLLGAARDRCSGAYGWVLERMPGTTNHSWITARCAETAYMRGIMSSEEMDLLCD